MKCTDYLPQINRLFTAGYWLDLYLAFLDVQRKRDSRLFVDGLHPSEAGYGIWRDRLVPALAAARAAAR